jgi:hypothetical protein
MLIVHSPQPPNLLRHPISTGRLSSNSPEHRYSDNKPALVPVEFVAEENINFCKDVSVNEGVNKDGKMVKTSNLPLPPQDKDPSETI